MWLGLFVYLLLFLSYFQELKLREGNYICSLSKYWNQIFMVQGALEPS